MVSKISKWWEYQIQSKVRLLISRIQDILQIVQTIYKSEFDKKYLVSFHVANSEKLVKVLQENDSYFLYTPEKFESRERLSYEKVSCLESKEFGRNVINDFSETHYNHVIKRENNENEKDFTWGIII